jgi:uncharacterized glyoxalase superfamily protein PhnB
LENQFPPNRSRPPATVIPEVPYPDVRAAAKWLCDAFGFRERLRIFDHRIQMTVGDGNVVVTDSPVLAPVRVMVRVLDADAHAARAEKAGAKIVNPPTDQPFGERQYTAEDFAGHRWTFSQTIADVDPTTWGGELVE